MVTLIKDIERQQRSPLAGTSHHRLNAAILGIQKFIDAKTADASKIIAT
ncbi:hypothetical protein ACF3DV_03640 [Chlorogloeopsis fritschii PCC 9212]|nr:hypothetical protein [Chlorogloeopsis fritschii]